MPLKVSGLNGIKGNKEKIITMGAYAIHTQGILNGFQITTNSVGIGTALLEVKRTSVTPNESFFVFVENTTAITIDTSGTKKVWLEIPQLNINDAGQNSADGIGIAVINTGASYPSSNYIPLASITSGVISNEDNFIKYKAGKVNGRLDVDQLTYKRAIYLGLWYNLDTLNIAGFYDVHNPTHPASSGLPAGFYYLEVKVHSNNNDYLTQEVTSGDPGVMNAKYTRTKAGLSGWTNWERLIVGGVPKISSIPDNRDIVQKLPSAYQKSVEYEFVPRIGCIYNLNIPGSLSMRYTLVTYAPWVDRNGGSTVQYAFGNSNGEVYRRTATNATTWGDWLRCDGEIRPGTSFTYATANTERTTTSNSYVLSKSAIVNKSGSYLVRYDIRTNGGANGFGILRINGKDVSPERSVSSTYTTFSETVFIGAGQKIELYIKQNGSDTCYCRNFQILYDVIEGITAVGTIAD